MAYVTVPKDLTHVKSKVLFGLTKRQLVCFGGGALIGVPLFFLLKGPVGTSTAAMCMMVVMLALFFGPELSFQQCGGPADDFCHAAGAAVRAV